MHLSLGDSRHLLTPFPHDRSHCSNLAWQRSIMTALKTPHISQMAPIFLSSNFAPLLVLFSVESIMNHTSHLSTDVCFKSGLKTAVTAWVQAQFKTSDLVSYLFPDEEEAECYIVVFAVSALALGLTIGAVGERLVSKSRKRPFAGQTCAVFDSFLVAGLSKNPTTPNAVPS
jgi:hypothetical protein